MIGKLVAEERKVALLEGRRGKGRFRVEETAQLPNNCPALTKRNGRIRVVSAGAAWQLLNDRTHPVEELLEFGLGIFLVLCWFRWDAGLRGKLRVGV